MSRNWKTELREMTTVRRYMQTFYSEPLNNQRQMLGAIIDIALTAGGLGRMTAFEALINIGLYWAEPDLLQRMIDTIYAYAQAETYIDVIGYCKTLIWEDEEWAYCKQHAIMLVGELQRAYREQETRKLVNQFQAIVPQEPEPSELDIFFRVYQANKQKPNNLQPPPNQTPTRTRLPLRRRN